MSYTIKGMEDLIKDLNPETVEKVMISALNTTTKRAVTKGNRAVRETYNIKAGDLKSYEKISRAKAGAIRTVVVVSSAGVPLYKFGGQSYRARTKGRKQYYGASAKPLKKSRRQRYKGTFPAVMSSGHLGMFTRSKSKRSRTDGRAAIREKIMITATSMFDSKGKDAMFDYVDDNLIDIFYKEYKSRAWRAGR